MTQTTIIHCECGSIAELGEDYLTVTCLGSCGQWSTRDKEVRITVVEGDVVAFAEFVSGRNFEDDKFEN